MKNTKKYNLPILFFSLIIVVGLACWYIYYGSDRNANNVSSTLTTSSPVKNNKTSQNKDTSDKIVFAAFINETKEIYQANSNGENKKLLFSDKDEADKIKKFGGLAYLSNEALVLIGDESVGKLAVISLNESGKITKVIDSFSSNVFAISPDGKTIAYTNFSNAERNYGYSLYTMNRDGSNKRKITQTSDEISSISWNKDSSKISILKIDKDGKSDISVVNIGTTKIESIYTSSKTIYLLNWNSADKITFTIATNKFTAGEIWAIKDDGGDAQKLYFNNNNLPLYGVLSSDNLNLGYNLENYKENINLTSEGELNTARLANNSLENQQNLGKTNIILGWF